jgi:glycosyltransferase involved in cell wall biosynthesis
MKILIDFEFHDGPWGGGNQFLKHLHKELKKRGHTMIDNRLRGYAGDADVVLVNSYHFGSDCFKSDNVALVHRIDGPTSLIRGHGHDLDKKLWEINSHMNATIFQSKWSLEQNMKLGYVPQNPHLVYTILNGTDTKMFPFKRRSVNHPGRIRLVTSSWSDNERKAAWILKKIDKEVDFNQRSIDYTFIGRLPGDYKQIKVMPSLPPEFLAHAYEDFDIFVAPSQNDPCSNAVIEAQACGLPVLYLNEGGHPEIVGAGGAGFHRSEVSSVKNFMSALERVYVDYESMSNWIEPRSIEDATDMYEEVFRCAISDLKRS